MKPYTVERNSKLIAKITPKLLVSRDLVTTAYKK